MKRVSKRSIKKKLDNWTVEVAEDAVSQHGIDLEKELTEAFAEFEDVIRKTVDGVDVTYVDFEFDLDDLGGLKVPKVVPGTLTVAGNTIYTWTGSNWVQILGSTP